MPAKVKKYRSITTKIISFASITFCVVIVVALFIVYPYLKDYTKLQIENFSVNTFSSFSYQLDEMFLSVERLGEQYEKDLISLANSEDFEKQSEKITASMLENNPFILKVVVNFFSETNNDAFLINSSNFGVLKHKGDNISNEVIYSEINEIIDSGIVTGKKASYWSAPYLIYDTTDGNNLSAMTGIYGISMISDRKVIGYVLLYCRISMIENTMFKLNIGGSSYNVLLGSDGNVAVHLLEKYIMQPTDIDDILSEIDNSKEHTFKIDSLGDFKCPNSTALAYKLINNWIFLTIFPEHSALSDYDNFGKIMLIILLFVLTFFGIITIGVNALLYNFKFVVKKTTDFSDYDILDWKIPVIRTNDDIEVLTTTFNRVHKAYINVQNKYADLITTNEKLTFDKKQLDVKIESIIQEETEEIMVQNKHLTTSLNNMAEFIKIGKAICSSLDIEEVSKIIYTHLEQIVPITFFGILLHNKEKNTLECECGIKNGEMVSNFSLNILEKNTVAGVCFDKNQTIFINNFDIEANRFLLINPFDPVNTKCNSQYFATIISENGEVLGVFTIQCQPKGVFKDFDVDYLDNMKNYLNMAINNIISYKKLKNYLTKMEQTQDRLIQNERMASVGQLSAGIAHEIKNPLNFVINFTEISTSLIKELNERISDYKDYKTPNTELPADTTLSEIEEDIEDMVDNMLLNLNKIEEHSKRVDQIIKNMMIHSNSRSEQFAQTDINNIVAEYSKLTYKGVRSNNPSFNIDVKYNLDKTIEPIYIVPNNFSRVIINIVSNSCFAIAEKSKKYNNSQEYTPELIITTTNLDSNYVEIKIRDNGEGIPNESKNKIFTPFFTTKPVGEGTGLGLSICYDIINIEHKGEITFDSEPNEFTEFIIKLPKKQENVISV